MKKKLTLIVVILFTLSVTLTGSFNSKLANAEVKNDVLIGSANLNNSAENSAKVGVSLTSPEKGWKRYDDLNEKFMYYNFSSSSYDGNYKNIYMLTRTVGAKLEFAFKGTKLRVISPKNNVFSNNVTIKIDGVSENFSEYDSLKFQVLVYEKLNLKSGCHKVEIISNDGSYVGFDALDIDGELVDLSSFKPEEPTNPENPSGGGTTEPENPSNPSENKVILSLTLSNGVTKEFNISKEEYQKFINCFDKSTPNKYTRYSFKTTQGNQTITDYILFDKIDSFEVRQL